MLPEDEKLIEDIKSYADDAEALKACDVRLLESLKNFDGDVELYKEAASKFVDDYEIVSSDLIDALYSGNNIEYMEGVRNMREASRKIGAVYLSYCFADHVNMAKDDSLDVAESNWRALVVEWENVVSGLANWLGKDNVQIGSTEVLVSATNGIRLPEKDIEERVEYVLSKLEENDQETAFRQMQKLSLYELDPDVRLKVERILKAFDQDNVNKAVDMLKSIIDKKD